MNEIWNERAAKYQKMVLKYLRYVLNDHLVLALLFLIGGLGLAYANWLKTLQLDVWYIKPVILIVLVLLTLIGRPVLLLEKPDKVFLMAQEKNISTYLTKSIKRTLFSVTLPLIIGNILVFPLLALEYHQIFKVSCLVLTVIIGTFANVLFKYQQLYYNRSNQFINPVIIGIVVAIGVMVDARLGVLLAFGVLINRILTIKKIFIKESFDWNHAIQIELNRMGQLYHFFSLFTTVKNIQPVVKRRKYADGLIRFLAGKQTIFTYLYPRMIVRSGNQGSLMLRLLFLGMLIEGYSNEVLLKVVIGAVITDLIVVQMVDVYRPVHENIFIKVYPTTVSNEEKSLLSVMKRIILISAIFLTLAGLITSFSVEFLLASVGTQLVVAILLLKWFIPRYIKKIN